MSQIFDPDDFWRFVTSPDIIDLILTVAAIMLLPLVIAQLHSLLSAFISQLSHRAGKMRLLKAIKLETAAVEAEIAELDRQFTGLRAEYDGVGAEHDAVFKELKAFRRAQIREVICADVFITHGTLPFSAVVRREFIPAEEEEHDPEIAAAWRKGRECLLYAENLAAAVLRFDRRFPKKGGYEVGPVGLFEIPDGPDRIKAA